MQALDLLQLRWIILMLGGGLALVLLVLLGFYGRSVRRGEAGEHATVPSVRDAYRRPKAVPWFLIVIWVCAGLFIVGYVVWSTFAHTNY